MEVQVNQLTLLLIFSCEHDNNTSRNHNTYSGIKYA
jgi:hypothetical protein